MSIGMDGLSGDAPVGPPVFSGVQAAPAQPNPQPDPQPPVQPAPQAPAPPVPQAPAQEPQPPQPQVPQPVQPDPPQYPTGSPTPTPPAPQQETPQQSAIRGKLAEFGYTPEQFGTASDDDIIVYLAQQARSVPAMRQYAEMGRVASEDWDAYKAWKDEQEKAAQAARPAEPEPYWPKPPEWDPDMEKFLELDANGNVVIRQDRIGMVSPTLPQQYMAYRKWQQDRQQALYRDPVAAILPGLEPQLNEKFISREEVEALLQERDNRGFVESWVASNEDNWYQKDPQTGRVLVDPTTGRPAMNEYGARYHEALNLLNAFDKQNPAHLVELAQRLAGPSGPAGAPTPAPVPGGQPTGAAQPGQPPVPQPPAPTPQETFVERAQQFANMPSAPRNGAQQAPPATSPRDLAPPSFSDIHAHLARAR